MMRAVFGAEAKDISILYLLTYIRSGKGPLSLAEVKNGAQQDKLIGGSNQVSWKLATLIEEKGGKVLLNHPVIHIQQSESSGVVITTANGQQFKSKYAILAIPPTQTSSIEFVPPFSYDRQLLGQKLFMGSYTKTIVTYKEAFWRQKGYSGEILCVDKDIENNPIVFGYDAAIPNGSTTIPALVVFTTGKISVIWTDRPREDYKKAVLKQLAKYFGEQALEPVDYLHKDWNTDPWTRGCPVNHFPTGAMELHKTLRLPFENLHFAGTETAENWIGYMSGAVESGERASTEVLWRLNGVKDWKQKIKEKWTIPPQKKRKFSLFLIAIPILIIACLLTFVFGNVISQ